MPLTVFPWHAGAWRDVLKRKATLPHALLLSGREGTGKLLFARNLAQSLACLEPDADGAACGGCLSCRWFAGDGHPDCRFVQPESMRPPEQQDTSNERKPSREIRIEEVRELRDFINLSSERGKTVVFYPAETLNTNAANALLKSLEEPPASTRFILVAHRASYLPATVRSRCQQIVLPVPSTAQGEEWLRNQGVGDAALRLAHTGNSPLAALALDDGEFWSQRKALLEELAGARVDALSLAARSRTVPVSRILGWLQRWSYDLLSANVCGRVRYNPDFEAVLLKTADGLRAAEIARYHRGLLRQQRIVNHPLNAQLFIEELLLSYAALLRGGRVRDSFARP